jgi:hypothetical protein
MDQKKRIELYIERIHEIHKKDPELKKKMRSDYEEYEKFMAEQLPRFKEKYPTLYKMAIREFDQPSFAMKLRHFLNISQSVLSGKTTLDDATKQVAQEQYEEYVAPLVKKKEEQEKEQEQEQEQEKQ